MPPVSLILLDDRIINPLYLDAPLDYEAIDHIVPRTEGGFILTPDEWALLRPLVDAFYTVMTAAQIQEENAALFEEVFAPDVAPDEEPKQMVRRNKKPIEGYIYSIYSAAGHYKIGKAKDPQHRQHTLGTEHAVETWLVYTAHCTDYARVELALHKAFADYRMNGEWFNLPKEKVDWLMNHTWVKDLGFEAIVSDCKAAPVNGGE